MGLDVRLGQTYHPWLSAYCPWPPLPLSFFFKKETNKKEKEKLLLPLITQVYIS